MAKPITDRASTIGWKRVRDIFDDPKPPEEVWERQFDYCNAELRRLARTPYAQIEFHDLGYYFHDLAYVELQPDLFNFLFPVCLMDWHDSLMRNESCSHGDSEFHYGIHQGDVLKKMLTAKRKHGVYEFFRDSLLERLDAERGFIDSATGIPGYGAWMRRFNSVAQIMPRIDMLWEPWWALGTPGRAVAALQYCSGLMYFEDENPVLPASTTFLFENDSFIFHAGWKPENIDFLTSTLNVEFVDQHVAKAVARLKGEPEWEKARRLEDDLSERQELIALRVAELPLLLGSPRNNKGWSV